jgi:tRNA dimethylallyltransferase
MSQTPIVIVGPTASGKSKLAISLARQLGSCQIISADAMAVYRGMDIGTAKPTAAERAEMPHHLIDVVEPTEDFGMAQFQEQAQVALTDIEGSGDRPIVVGGTGLYVRSIVDNFEAPPRFPAVVVELEREIRTSKLFERLVELDPQAATKMEPTNRRRIVRALEVTVGSGRPFSSFGPGVDAYPPTRFVQIGLEIDREVMDQAISDRYDRQMTAGFLQEVAQLPPLSKTAGQALGYRELLLHIGGELSLDAALEEATSRTRRFARRQQRWFRRDPRIRWLDAQSPTLLDDAVAIATASGPA